MKMKEVRPVRSKSYLKHKLISAGAMLLVSAIMMVSSSYAWYVLSTAPEVSNIKTQVGANGALEIALLNGDSWTNLDLLDMGDIDESLGDNPISAALANLTWGNLVDLDDASYGLDKIVLQPSRLFIENAGAAGSDGNNQHTRDGQGAESKLRPGDLFPQEHCTHQHAEGRGQRQHNAAEGYRGIQNTVFFQNEVRNRLQKAQ